MSELKTLKDFKITYDNGTSFFEIDNWRTNSGEWFVKRLRQEAIKHLKNISSDNWDTIYYSNPLLIRFFNITKEDVLCKDKDCTKDEVKG